MDVKPHQTWKHTNSNEYTVLHVTNTAVVREGHEPDVVYQGSNGSVWSRPLADWHRSFTLVRAHPARGVVDEAMVRDLLPEGWTPDCQGKQDFDTDLVSLSCRYYPGNYSRDGSHSVKASIILGDGQQAISTISTCDFSAESEAEVKALAEGWARQQIASLIAALQAAALPADPQQGDTP